MKVRYLNYQNELDPMNGAVITAGENLAELLDKRRNEPPFLAELSGDNGYHIEFGIGGDIGCVQHSPANGKAPYLMAISAHPPMKSGYIEFLTADTPTPFAARYIISFDELKAIALHFLKTGKRSDEVLWQELDPRAIKEDAERQSKPH
jgi:hypothetical protein